MACVFLTTIYIAGKTDKKKSVFGYLFFLGGGGAERGVFANTPLVAALHAFISKRGESCDQKPVEFWPAFPKKNTLQMCVFCEGGGGVVVWVVPTKP